MSKLKSVSIVDIIKEEKEKEQKTVEVDFEEPVASEDEEQPETVHTQDVEVDFNDVDVEEIQLEEIRDEHGRISDIIESLEQCTGLSVIPLEMGHIAPEVSSLERHKIFEYNGVRYAMSHNKRMHVIKAYKERIIRLLSSGLPFKESLNTTVVYDGKDYETLSLSEDEWKYLMAMFRKYKEHLFYGENGKLFLEVLPDRED